MLWRLVGQKDYVDPYTGRTWLPDAFLWPSTGQDHVPDALVKPALDVAAEVIAVCRAGHLSRSLGEVGRFKRVKQRMRSAETGKSESSWRGRVYVLILRFCDGARSAFLIYTQSVSISLFFVAGLTLWTHRLDLWLVLACSGGLKSPLSPTRAEQGRVPAAHRNHRKPPHCTVI